jgi:hypothetical protein
MRYTTLAKSNINQGQRHDYRQIPIMVRFMDLLAAGSLAGKQTKGLDSPLYPR